MKSLFLAVFSLAALAAGSQNSYAGSFKAETCKTVANNIFVKDDCRSIPKVAGSCDASITASGAFITIADEHYRGTIESAPVFGHQDLFRVKIGGLVSGSIARKNGRITTAELFVNKDPSGREYTKYVCRVNQGVKSASLELGFFSLDGGKRGIKKGINGRSS